jgi:hypothetical protein
LGPFVDLTDSIQYSRKGIDDLESIVDSRVLDLMEHILADWVSALGSTVVFNCGRWIRHVTLDTITHISFGRPTDHMETDRDALGFTDVIQRLLPFVLQLSLCTEFNSPLPIMGKARFLGRRLFPHHSLTYGLGRLRAVS